MIALYDFIRILYRFSNLKIEFGLDVMKKYFGKIWQGYRQSHAVVLSCKNGHNFYCKIRIFAGPSIHDFKNEFRVF